MATRACTYLTISTQHARGSWWVQEPQEQTQRNRHGWQSMLPGRVLSPRPQEFLVWSRSVQY